MMPIIVQTTCASKDEAKKIAELLVKDKVAACTQIKKIESIYTWKDKIYDEVEFELSIKTKKENFKKIKRIIKENHSYDLPQIIAINIAGTSKQYLKYLDENIK
ncbi:MAG: divalent-cation tolerance protein CutA [Sphaerochaetaceae bacterium]|nr:divalent-cation tolerance protein CutA [Sphaerochaetaceae bacterium]